MQVTSLLVDSNTPVHLLKTTNSGLIKDTKIGLFDKSKISKFWNVYQTLPSNSIEEPVEISRYCNVDNNRVAKMLGKVKNEPPEEEIGLGIWNSIGTWFGYEPTERPVRPHAPTPDVIYPEILVIIDYELYASFDTLNELVSRLYAFWEGVDKLYAPLSNPKFKLSIAGVLVPTDPDVFEFLKESSSIFSWFGGIDYTDVKSSMDSWLYKYKDTFSEDTYDVFIVMTPSRDNGLFSTTIGLSTLGGVCNVDNFTQRLSRGAIIFETPDFKDTLTAAHELGHLFGLYHDGDVGCGNNNIMSTVNKRYNTEWSSCSQEGLRRYLSNYEAMCLYNKPKSLKM
ncbi:A disintegrin and metalloproteinase with thrombospondin motifs like [Cotesia typhae]|uniref:A disintegrin and metalloproteinase with thrombospondin motifs like n=1 Tax=Cotesia typhae TaxID=2053667 RepID=UPI003D682A70